MMQCTECCDQIVQIIETVWLLASEGVLEIHSVIKGENEALLSIFDHYEASLMDEDNL